MSLLRGPAGKQQGRATTEPQGRLRARNPAPGVLKNAAAKAANVTSLMPRSKINAIMPRVVYHDYGNIADGEICLRKRCYEPLPPLKRPCWRDRGTARSGGLRAFAIGVVVAALAPILDART
jgi:hypothetical protein